MAGPDKPETAAEATPNPANNKRSDLFEDAMGGEKKLNGPTGPQQSVRGDGAAVAPATATGDIAAPKPPDARPAEAKSPAANPPEARPAEARPAEARPAEARPAEARPAEVRGAEAPRTANPNDATQPPKPADRPKPEDVLKNVNRILDTEIPALNKAGQLDKAKEAYERAIKEAEKVSKEDIEKAKLDLLEVRKKMLTEKNPEEKAKLKQQELDLFSLSRVKDAAYGNMALWYFRQGKVDEGTTKLFQAAGVDEETARKHNKLTPADMDALGAKIPDVTKVTIFDDMNFQRQMVRLRDEAKVAVPESYFNLNKYVHAKTVEATTAALLAPPVAAATAADSPPVAPRAGMGDTPPAVAPVVSPADANPVVARQPEANSPGAKPPEAQPGVAPAVTPADANPVVSRQPEAKPPGANTPGADPVVSRLTEAKPPEAQPGEAPRVAEVNTPADRRAEATAEITIDPAKNLELVTKAASVLDALKATEKPTAISPEQRKAVEDAIRAFQQEKAFHDQEAQKATVALSNTLGDKSPSFIDAVDKFQRTSETLVQSGKVTKEQAQALASFAPANAAEREAARKALQATQPDLVNQSDEIAKIGGDKTVAALGSLRAIYDHVGMKDLAAQRQNVVHVLYGTELVRVNDIPAAKVQAEAFFKDMTSEQALLILNGDGTAQNPPNKIVADLVRATGMEAPTAPAAAVPGLLPIGDQSKPLPERVKELDGDQLSLMILDASKAGGRGLETGKAAFEELIGRFSDKQFLDQNRAIVVANQDILKKDQELREKQAKGEALGPNERILSKEERGKLHFDNLNAIRNLTEASDLQFNYAKFLGDFATRAAIATRASAANPYVAGSLQVAAAEKIAGGNNQLASMEAQALLAIKASDAMPVDLINQQAALIKKDKGQVADERQLNQGLTMLEGGTVTDAAGNQGYRSPLINRGIDQRAELALMYLGNETMNQADMQVTRSTATQAPIDRLFKPDKAVALLEDAQAQYARLHPGQRLNDPVIERAIQTGKELSPEVFQKLADRAAERYASPQADGVAFLGALAGEAGAVWLAKRAGLPGNIATQVGNVGALTGAIGTRTVAYRAFSGRWDTLENNAVHGGAVGLGFVGFRYAQRSIMGSDTASNLIASRASRLTDQTVATRLVGEGGIGSKFAEQAVLTGRTTEATVAKAISEKPELFAKQVSQMTDNEVAQMYSSLGISTTNRMQRLELLRDGLKANPIGDAARLERMQAGGATTVGEFEALAKARNQRIGEIASDLEATAFKAESRGVIGRLASMRNPDAKVEDVLRGLQKADPAKYTDEAIKANLDYLKANGVTSVKDLQGHYLMSSRADIDGLIAAAQREGLLNKTLLSRNPEGADLSSIISKLKKNNVEPELVARMEARLPSLKRMEVNTVADLARAGERARALQSMETLSTQYPGVAGITGDTTLAAVAQADARAFGATGSARQMELDRILGIKPPKVENDWVNNLYRDRFYNVGDIAGPWINGARNRFFRNAEDAVVAPSRRNWGKINAETSSLTSVDRAVGQANTRAALAGAAATSIIYRTSTGVYDLVLTKDATGQKRQYEYEPGKFRDYTVTDALMESIFSKGNSVPERIINGGVLSDIALGGAGFSMARGGLLSEAAQWGAFGYFNVFTRSSPQDGKAMEAFDSAVSNIRAPLVDQPVPNTGLAIDNVPKPAQPVQPVGRQPAPAKAAPAQPQPGVRTDTPAAPAAAAPEQPVNRPEVSPGPAEPAGLDEFIGLMNGN